MKPNWENAPEWAQWLAQDADGQWCWFRHKPLKESEPAMWNNNLSLSVKGQPQWQRASKQSSSVNWRRTLEERPILIVS
jgi:hypothetical protein